MHPKDVLRDPSVVVRVHLVKDNKDEVKTREKGVLHTDVVHWGLVLVILPWEDGGAGEGTFRTSELCVGANAIIQTIMR